MGNIEPGAAFSGVNSLTDYLVDAGQRMVLYWDIMRRRGNQYLEHINKPAPHVLQFSFEVLIDGRTLRRLVNYALVRIIPPEGTVIDEQNRPFVIIDPRAGHGPGIGGFKANSEIGVALQAGHPCYYIGFLPTPEPGQNLDTIMQAEAHFLERIIELHPEADGNPVLIGNCQAGWALMMLAASRPELCGPIILAGAPLSYWAGVRGNNPMRYTGGLLGGSWLTALTSDLGNGLFDGAWLVQNFENLNPANTLWGKQYNLYAKADTEGPRYLEFERWWGGHVLLNGEEIQSIVDDLFIGNKLSSTHMVTHDGIRIDFRQIRSPIVCFCSKGDNITPPQQALDWILDLYGSVDDIRASGQTIIYAVHPSVGHLGIFVSGKVAKKEHQEFSSNIDFIDCMPPGLYEAVIQEKTTDTENPDLVRGEHVSRFERRTLDDIRALGTNDMQDERAFATVARLSEVTHGVYRTMWQPIVRSLATEQGAEWMRRMHPLRLGYELLSDSNPLMGQVASAAQMVKENRKPVQPDNIFWQWQGLMSDWILTSLNIYRDWRDMLCEQTFFGIYEQPWLQALLGLRASDEPMRRYPGHDPAHIAHVRDQIEELKDSIDKGAIREATIRALIYVRLPEGAADERGFEAIRRIRAELEVKTPLSEFKETFRKQFLMLLLDEDKAVKAIPHLLRNHSNEAPKAFEYLRTVATAGGPLGEEASKRLEEMAEVFTTPGPQPENQPTATA